MKYQLNVGAHRGLVTYMYHINLLKRYNRNIVMNIHDFKINYRSGARNGPFHVAVILEISVGKSTTTLSPGEKWHFLVFLSYQAFICDCLSVRFLPTMSLISDKRSLTLMTCSIMDFPCFAW
jgi:hypothetical protein